ncbi:MAG TPA: DUF4293 domain-containing protein [Saprospiraceae bacterium]|nr:DUF4293 domain-containing protein [Saprospiraceae bacterium]HMP25285.1 DUF4293 domain-containing protein [Saprospiraceae bacterium]
MIQRIQTIFLLLAALAASGTFFLPFASSPEAVANSILADQTYDIWDNIVLEILFGATVLISLISIFQFKNRKQQMRTNLFALFFVMVGAVIVIVQLLQANNLLDAGNVQPTVGFVAPFVTIVFLSLAYYFIKKDEKLVKSMDRLR